MGKIVYSNWAMSGPGWLSGASRWEWLSLWAQARQEGGSALGSFPAMFSLYTHLEPEPLLDGLPHWESPFPLACLPASLGLLALVSGLKS